MKNAKCPTRSQKIKLKALGINPEAWLISIDCPDRLVIVHRVTEKVRTLNMRGLGKCEA